MSEESKTKHTIYHVLILDSSGSMESVRKQTIDGFNENLKTIRDSEQDDVEQLVCLVAFSTGSPDRKIWNKPIKSAEELSIKTYVPGGGTALLDAMGTTVKSLQDEIKEQIEARTANVIVTIFTDGEENSSCEFSGEQISALKEELEKSRMWTFTLIGCSEETLKSAMKMGFQAGNVMRYAATAQGTSRAFADLSRSRAAYTKGVVSASACFAASGDDEEYKANLGALQADFFAADSTDNQQDKKDKNNKKDKK